MTRRTSPVDVPVDVITTPALQNGVAEPVAPTTAGQTVGAAAMTRGRIWGVRAFKHNAATPKVGQTGGSVVVVLYKDSGYTEELFAQTLDFTTRSTVTVNFNSAIRCFEQPYFQVTGDANSAGDFLDITLEVEAMG